MEFHLIRNGKQEGPFTVEELSQQGINPESEVWAPGMADWMQAGDVPELTVPSSRHRSNQPVRPRTRRPWDSPTNPVCLPKFRPSHRVICPFRRGPRRKAAARRGSLRC